MTLLSHSAKAPDLVDRFLVVPFVGTVSACVFVALKSLGVSNQLLAYHTYYDLSVKGIPFYGSYCVMKDVSRATKIKKIVELAARAENLKDRAVHFANQSKLEKPVKDSVLSEWQESNSKLMTLLTSLEASLANDATAKEDIYAEQAAFRALVSIKGKKGFFTVSSAINTSKCISIWRSIQFLKQDFAHVPDVELALIRAAEAKEIAFHATKTVIINSMQTIDLKLYL